MKGVGVQMYCGKFNLPLNELNAIKFEQTDIAASLPSLPLFVPHFPCHFPHCTLNSKPITRQEDGWRRSNMSTNKQ